MSALYPDTHPEMEAMQIQIIRRMPSRKKFSIVNDLNAMVKTLAVIGIRQRHPYATSEKIYRMLAGLMPVAEPAEKIYGYTK